MLKRIWMPFLALAIVSCSSEMTESNNEPVAIEKNTGFTLKTVTTLRDFSLRHAQLTMEINAIFQSTANVDIEYGDTIMDELAQAEITVEVQNILTSYGMGSDDTARIVVIAQQQFENYTKFVSDNPDFAAMDITSQETMILGGLQGIIDENPGNIFPIHDPIGVEDCLDRYLEDIEDCREENYVNTGLALLTLVTGPVSGVIAAVGATIQAVRCTKKADRDYKRCLRGT